MDNITIDNFSGPLDLLLHLVRISNIDILDIKIEEITDKYLDYIEAQKELNIDISSSYLVLAAELIYLKSKSLLPVQEKDEDNEEEITKENLINKLLEYKRYKELTPEFKLLEEERKKIYIKSPENVNNYIENITYNDGNVEDLLNAFKKFLSRKEMEKPLETTITTKEYSIKDTKANIKNILTNKKHAYLEDLLDEYNRPYLVVTFLSILELVKEKEVIIKQNNNFDRILIELRN